MYVGQVAIEFHLITFTLNSRAVDQISHDQEVPDVRNWEIDQ